MDYIVQCIESRRYQIGIDAQGYIQGIKEKSPIYKLSHLQLYKDHSIYNKVATKISFTFALLSTGC
jgi:hypothetical protein